MHLWYLLVGKLQHVEHTCWATVTLALKTLEMEGLLIWRCKGVFPWRPFSPLEMHCVTLEGLSLLNIRFFFVQDRENGLHGNNL